MNFKNLALVSTSLVALGFSVTASHAATTMGRVDLGFTEWFDDTSGGEGGNYNWPSVTGWARVNVPYNDRVNVGLEFFGDGSLDSNSGGENYSIGVGNVGAGAHINWRDPSQGLLGVFAATGRVWDNYYYNSPVIMAGLEGQYYCGPWTFYGQAGYMDSSNGYYYTLSNAGFVRGLVSYYATPKLKVSGGLAYMDGEDGYSDNVTAWAWEADAEYWFGKSVPVAVTLRYQGRDSSVDYSSHYDLNSNEVTLGVSFFFGGGDIEDFDRNGPGTEIPNFDWFRLY